MWEGNRINWLGPASGLLQNRKTLVDELPLQSPHNNNSQTGSLLKSTAYVTMLLACNSYRLNTLVDLAIIGGAMKDLCSYLLVSGPTADFLGISSLSLAVWLAWPQACTLYAYKLITWAGFIFHNRISSTLQKQNRNSMLNFPPPTPMGQLKALHPQPLRETIFRSNVTRLNRAGSRTHVALKEKRGPGLGSGNPKPEERKKKVQRLFRGVKSNGGPSSLKLDGKKAGFKGR